MLETERLALRPFVETDTDAVFALRSDGEMMRFIRAPQGRKEAEGWIRLVSSRWTDEKIGLCAVLEKAAGQLIGWCGLWRLKETREIEIGYAIDKKLWGRGFATEAAAATLEYGFDNLELDKIVAVARPENKGSWRVMEKLGMTFDYTGEFYDRQLVHYSITRSDWQKRRAAATNYA
jgi:RimJ/RimL family protein N-acetyltransferase